MNETKEKSNGRPPRYKKIVLTKGKKTYEFSSIREAAKFLDVDVIRLYTALSNRVRDYVVEAFV